MVADEKCGRCKGVGFVAVRSYYDKGLVIVYGFCPDCEGAGTDATERERCAEWREAVGD